MENVESSLPLPRMPHKTRASPASITNLAQTPERSLRLSRMRPQEAATGPEQLSQRLARRPTRTTTALRGENLGDPPRVASGGLLSQHHLFGLHVLARPRTHETIHRSTETQRLVDLGGYVGGSALVRVIGNQKPGDGRLARRLKV